MSYTVLHLEKAKGNDAAMSAHIERTIHPKNADKTREYLNKEFIVYPRDVKNRTAAIQYRIDHAQIKRKIGINQVRAIRIMLSGTHDTMKKIEESGNLDNWCMDNLDWLNETFGEDNLVSAVLHMDEKTPHIHATIVPIVSGERRKASNGKTAPEKYKKKNPTNNRLCADDIMARNKLTHYQNTYAIAMQKYGLNRGIEGSMAKHISTGQYYRDLHLQNQLLMQEHTKKQSELKAMEKTINTKKAMETVTNVFTGSKTKKLERENEMMKKEFKSIILLKDQEKSEIQKSVSKLRNMVERKDSILAKLVKYHPDLKASYSIILECEKLRFSPELIKHLLEKEEIYIKGEVYSSKHFKSFNVDHLKVTIEYDSKEKAKVLKIDDLNSQQWLDEKHKESLRSKSQNNSIEIQNQRKIRR
ncbi:mobilization protein [Elizabethkingia anophelis]|uniref:MobV family relaxase n=1 Tax=Elizabethkingia anophelis TaxID=1117645 RepID=UPI00136BF811|nr:MobV family relaxase [Elizabethkingia anophelis]MDV3575000.1 mobilization protein [Elizabethkingia anophelis]MDV3599291.1 mobilization protein [Elizabethkingia anophelis]MDV3607145.1 mobilization protein [Elizabethkingia anophelis]MDV3640351.1 mobilization protein [Elizabethkingia anophelis]MDV3648141.1 mobilization protein [Elizabethkingia anophelis]